MLERARSLTEQASSALQTSDVSTLVRLCAEAESLRPAQGQIGIVEADAFRVSLAGFQRQVHLAGNNVRLRQVLLDTRTGVQRRWER